MLYRKSTIAHIPNFLTKYCRSRQWWVWCVFDDFWSLFCCCNERLFLFCFFLHFLDLHKCVAFRSNSMFPSKENGKPQQDFSTPEWHDVRALIFFILWHLVGPNLKVGHTTKFLFYFDKMSFVGSKLKVRHTTKFLFY